MVVNLYAAAVNIILTIVYIAIGVGIGMITNTKFGYTTVVSMCFGGMFTLACGLVHSIIVPKKFRLPRQFTSQINTELEQLRLENEKTRAEFEEFKEQIIEESRMREEKIVDELKELAQSIAVFAAQKQARGETIAPLTPRPKRSERSMLAAVQEAIDASRVEIHLQPIVTLPQRRISFYECFTRLRDSTGQLIMPGEFLKVAENSGLVAEIDNMLLLKCVQLARQTIRRDRRISLFCNISPTSLGDETFFAQFVDYLKQNRDLVGSLIFELTRDAFERLGMTAERNMGRLFDLGYRFSIDRCESIDVDLRKLERMGVRYVKIAGTKLVQQLLRDGVRPITGLAREFEPQDVASLFARYGVDLIADRVEDERVIIEALELDLGFAQGNLFGAPRPLGEVISPDTDGDILRKRA
jgi:cyclic-di-GMP phosphodiesterase TipF (flagellum assembly factor)